MARLAAGLARLAAVAISEFDRNYPVPPGVKPKSVTGWFRDFRLWAIAVERLMATGA